MKEKFEIDSNSNILFVIDQCNNHCIMCCQPPKKRDDFDYYFKKNIALVKSAPKETKEVCITGGEPTLAGDKLFELVKIVREELPDTVIQILSNGRTFKNHTFAHHLKEVGGDKVFVGVPLHSDYAGDHDRIAGAKGAFYETMLGLYNLGNEEIPVELRIVINKMNYHRLPQMAEFIFKNLYFAAWTAWMGMEDTGYATKNSKQIWIEPIEYIPQLCSAIKYLSEWDLPASIFNIPLCLLPEEYHQYAAQSISDWKTRFLDICDECVMKEKCCGLFATSKKVFKGINSCIKDV